MRIEPYWIEGSFQGKLAIIPRPRGGDWLEDEVRSWRQSGIDIVVSLLTPDEIVALGIIQEEQQCQAIGIKYLSFPIVDRSVPLSRKATSEFVGELEKCIFDGKAIAIHCRQGIGRSALIAACLLVSSGLDVDDAFQRISLARGYSVPETAEQREWVRKFAQELFELKA
jgi:protein-tyrosine phosphatase